MTAGTALDLLVDRSDLHRTRLVERPAAALRPGQARLRIDGFGLSANNVTYAVIADMLGYWSFFPAPEGWGRVPVWGFAEVTEIAESSDPGLVVGRRVYGFLPMSSELVVDVGQVGESGFRDVAAHREPMAAAYNRYAFVSSEPGSEEEDRWMVLQPLFFTSFLVDDFLADHDFFGASVVVVSSASSKTGLGIARAVAQRGGPGVVGLTSPAKVAFTSALGVYDRVLDYGDLAALPDGRAVYVDVSGSLEIRTAVHGHFADDLVHDMMLGVTHRDEMGSARDLPGVAPTFFFAPTQIDKRVQDWGRAGLDERIAAAWSSYSPWAAQWVDFHHGRGAASMIATWLELLDNRADPAVGHVGSLNP